MTKKTVPQKRTLARKIVKKSKLKKGSARNGALYAVATIAVVATFGAVMAGGAVPVVQKLQTPNPPGNPYSCCDSGDGVNCHPLTGAGQVITYNGQTYGLLKSNVAPGEVGHLVPTNNYTPTGQRIFINTSAQTADHSIDHTKNPTCGDGRELINVPNAATGANCFGVPDGEIIYVCTDTPSVCNQQVMANATPFNVYYRLADGPVPSPIANDCPKPSGSLNSTAQQVINVPTPEDRKNLQLETFQVLQKQQPMDWLGDWCKPAINLYPPEKMSVHVQVTPEGRMNYTIPTYPPQGWDVTAYPDGAIIDNNKSYPYLYWEAALPDNLITPPQDGYVVPYPDLGMLFQTVLPQIGMNIRETTQFSDYWTKALPKSNFYFVGLMPQNQIDALAPLTITPEPDSILRVSLYFKALDQEISVNPPQLAPFHRKGFTVTEWGGFFKKDKNHPHFTCMM